jgi:hypothetical protein
MAEANHYCASCDTHFRADLEQHAEIYHDGGVFRGIEQGNYQDYKRLQQHRK